MQISDRPARPVASRRACFVLRALRSAASPRRRPHADDLQEASKLLKAGQHQQALERVEPVLAAKPRDAQARFLKGLILTEQGKHAGSDRDLHQAHPGLSRAARAVQQPRRHLRAPGPIREGARRARAIDPHASELRHRLREPRRRLREAREPGLRQGAAARLVQHRRAEQAVAGRELVARAGAETRRPSRAAAASTVAEGHAARSRPSPRREPPRGSSPPREPGSPPRSKPQPPAEPARKC